MSSQAAPTDLPTYSFRTVGDFRDFLDREHATAPGFYLKLAKKTSGIPSVSADQAIETALCFGWINGWGKGLDNQWYVARYTPRRAKSLWSQKNVATVGRLLEEGLMHPAGVAAVDAAKADGRWERAYAGPATIQVPDDLAAALATAPAANSFFKGMNSGDRYAVLWRVETSSPKNRPARIRTLIQLLTDGKRPGAPAIAKAKVAKKGVIKQANKGQALAKQLSAPAKCEGAQHTQGRQPRRAGLRPRS